MVVITLIIVVICCCCKKKISETTVKPYPGSIDVELPKRDKKKKKDKNAPVEDGPIDVGNMGSLSKKKKKNSTGDGFFNHVNDQSALKAMQPTDDEKSGQLEIANPDASGFLGASGSNWNKKKAEADMALARNSAQRFSPNLEARRAKMETIDDSGLQNTGENALPAIGSNLPVESGANTNTTSNPMQFTMTSFLKNPTQPVPDQDVSHRSNRAYNDQYN